MKSFPLISTPSFLSKLPVRVSTQAIRDITYLHFHRQMQLCFVLSGELKHYINGIEYTQKAGSCAFLLPYIPHHLSAIGSEDTPIIAHIWFDLDFLTSRGYDIYTYGKKTTHFERKEIPDIFDYAGEEEFSIKTVRELIAEFEKRADMSYDRIAALISELFRHACKEDKKIKITAPFRRQAEAINRTAEYIEKNFSAKLSLDELCEIADTSRRSFTANFKTVTGITPNEYILSTRISHASFLLISSARLYDDIAKESGLYNYSNLGRVFLKSFGITPTEYKSLRIDELKLQKSAKPLSRFNWIYDI